MTDAAPTTCEFEIRHAFDQVLGGEAIALSCKTHGELVRDRVTAFNTDCQIFSRFAIAKKAHLELHQPKPKPQPVVLVEPDQPRLTSCEQLLVERVDHDSGVHYLILLCKLHGQLCEEVINPPSYWLTHNKMQLLWKQHVAEYKDRPKTAPKKPQPSPEPTVSPYSYKRKFS